MKLNSRGSISAIVKPDTGQENFSLNIKRLAGMPAPFIAPVTARADPITCKAVRRPGIVTSTRERPWLAAPAGSTLEGITRRRKTDPVTGP